MLGKIKKDVKKTIEENKLNGIYISINDSNNCSNENNSSDIITCGLAQKKKIIPIGIEHDKFCLKNKDNEFIVSKSHNGVDGYLHWNGTNEENCTKFIKRDDSILQLENRHLCIYDNDKSIYCNITVLEKNASKFKLNYNDYEYNDTNSIINDFIVDNKSYVQNLSLF